MWKDLIQEIIISTDNLENIKDTLKDNQEFKERVSEMISEEERIEFLSELPVDSWIDSVGRKELLKIINEIK